MLAAVMEVNVQALTTRGSEEDKAFFLPRYDTVAKTLTDNKDACAQDGVRHIQEMCSQMNVIGLAEYGMTRDMFGEAIAKGRKSSSMKGNPIYLTDGELELILEKSM